MGEDFVSIAVFNEYKERASAERQSILDENKRQNQRIDALEQTTKQINDLTISVAALASNIERLTENINVLTKDVKDINDEPKKYISTAKNAIISGVCAAAVAAIIFVIRTYI